MKLRTRAMTLFMVGICLFPLSNNLSQAKTLLDTPIQTRLFQTSYINTNARWSPDGEWIAFVSNRSGNLDIWIVRPDGSELKNITSDSTAAENLPEWSPDGQQIAFVSNQACNKENCWSNIWLMDKTGANPVNLTGDLGGDTGDFFSWSHNGKSLAITRYPADEPITQQSLTPQIWIVDVEGDQAPRRISPDDGTSYLHPDWSPDDSHVVFMGRRPHSIAMASVDGGEFTRLEITPYQIWFVQWSPIDENLIAFSRKVDSEFQVGFLNLDTNTISPINLPSDGRNPIWSPDGKKIGFWLGNFDIGFDVGILEVESETLNNITKDTESWDIFSGWSPDGTQIAFISNRSGADEIWVMNVDGSNPINITGQPQAE